jgi:hypothetical protein
VSAEPNGWPEVLGPPAGALPHRDNQDLRDSWSHPDNQQKQAPARSLSLRSLADAESKKTRFLWEGMIPQSAVTICAGRGGVAKSTFAIWLGGQLNQGILRGELYAQPTSVLYVSHEDSLEEVVLPRVDANDADRTLFYSLGIESKEVGGITVPRLPEDLPLIRQAIEETDAKLLIIDPITSTLSGGDNDRMADVRQVMDPLNAMAAELGVSVIGIAHFRKGGGSQSDMISGSHAWRDAARCVILFARDEEADCTVITLEKINSGQAGKSFKYHLDIVQQLTDEGTFTDVGKVVWEGESTASVGDIINNEQERSRQGSTANELLEYMRSFKGRAVKGEDIVKHFAVDGVKPATVRQNLGRMVTRGLLTKPAYGWFAAVMPPDEEASRARGGVIGVTPVELAESVTGTTGVTPPRARDNASLCRICGYPLADVVIASGERVHPTCDR